jgi:hypothetical protein
MTTPNTIFISYTHAEAAFVDKLEERLKGEGFDVWRDVGAMLAGNIQTQVESAIEARDIVITVLSENSLESDYVEKELADARRKEQTEKRHVMCPVALDDKWKTKMTDPLWRKLGNYLILDFSTWKTKAFDTPFKKLVDGIRANYEAK